MKKQGVAIGIIILIVVVISNFLLTRPEKLGNMSHNYSELITTISNVSFYGNNGDRIKFSFRSTIESGNLDILLYDSEGNKVYELDSAKKFKPCI